MNNDETTLRGKCYHIVDRLAKRIGINASAVHGFNIIGTDKVVAVGFKYKDMDCTGHAICMRGDVFNFDIGLNIAIARAMRVAAHQEYVANVDNALNDWS